MKMLNLQNRTSNEQKPTKEREQGEKLQKQVKVVSLSPIFLAYNGKAAYW